MHRGLFAGKIPIEISEPSATWMVLEANAVERLEIRARKLGGLGKTGFFVSIVPDEKYFVACIEGVDLEFVIGIASGDEEFDIIVVVNGVVVIRVLGVDERFLKTISEIEVLFVPQ